ncbi:hypothetical protein [Limnoglobus roseus]|uniref:Uncharacterized protein n=1 Tax=Limnoglobus roseus TaxID=2598579 RepID=A0A5C1ACS0_9BACT|nr:hypothetical protein [Limnoglobus roseus]QEL17091.1 hypothetical protein PX52LOC_04068 [Limnoglobus roseus]
MSCRILPLFLLLAGCAGSSSSPPAAPAPSAPDEPGPRRNVPRPTPPPEPKNVVFTRTPLDPGRIPTVRAIELPKFHAAASVWGSTGRDHRGHIYYGVSTDGNDVLSAHLIEFDPATNLTTDRGGVVENLKRLGLAKPRENQNKIHSKIWQAADGFLYFASLDEGDENDDGTKLPTFGSHLWRVKPEGGEWEHLADVREAVIASALGGRYVYFLGYFGHVLYQWDTERGTLSNTVRVGSVGGHTTRNILADGRDHAFVPRVTAGKVELIEYDEKLQEQAAFPLTGYSTSPDSGSHGIVGVTQLKDEGFAFVTDKGRLYRLTPRATGSAVVDLGNVHPDGECYCPTLFSYDGESNLVGIGHRPSRGEPTYEWLAFDLRTRRATAAKLAVPVSANAWKGLLIYGSQTRDDEGRFYVGGRFISQGETDRSVPAAWQVMP